MSVHFSNGSTPKTEVDSSLSKSGVSQTKTDKIPGASVIPPTQVADVGMANEDIDERQGLGRTVSLIGDRPQKAHSLTEASKLAQDVHTELDPSSTEVPTTNAARGLLTPSQLRTQGVIDARSSTVTPVTPVPKPGNIRAQGVHAARSSTVTPVTATTVTPVMAATPVPKPGNIRAQGVLNARTGQLPSIIPAKPTTPKPPAKPTTPKPTTPKPPAKPTTPKPTTPKPTTFTNPPLLPSKKEANNIEVSPFETKNENVPKEEIKYNKDLCTLLRFGPYDDTNSEYIELDSIKFQTNKLQFLGNGLGQKEMKAYYNITSKDDISMLQNVFGVTSMGRNPYIYDFIKKFKSKENICRFDGIEVVLSAISNRKNTMEGQIKVEKDNAKLKRLNHQLEWFTETIEVLQAAKSSDKKCEVVPSCSRKKSAWSWPSLGSNSISKSTDCPCLTDINLLYDLVLLVNHLHGTAPDDVKKKLRGMNLQELLKIATNKNSKDDMSGHIKVVLGHLLEYLTALKESGNVADNDVLLRLYKLINGSDQARTSITEEEFEDFIDELNKKLNMLVTTDSELKRYTLQIEELKRQLKKCQDNSAGFTVPALNIPGNGTTNFTVPHLNKYDDLQAKLDSMTEERDTLQLRINEALEILKKAIVERDAAFTEIEKLHDSINTQREKYLKQILELNQEIARLKEELISANIKYKASMEKGNKSKELLELRTEIDKLTKEKGEILALLLGALDELRKTTESLTNLKNQTDVIISQLKAELAEAQAELEKLRNSTGSGSNVYNARIQVLEKLVEDTKEALKQASNLIDVIINDLKLVRDQMKVQIDALEKELASTKAELEELQGKHAEDLRKLEEMQAMVASSLQELEAAQAALKGLRGRPKISAENDISKLKAELKAARDELELLREKCKGDDKRVKDLEDTINTIEADIANLLNELAELYTTIEQLQQTSNKRDKMTTDVIKALLEKIDKLEADFRELRDQNGFDARLQEQLDGYQEAFLQEFNKNVEKDELIKTYRELINGLSTLGDSTRNELLATLQKLSEKDADYDRLIKTLEDEMQKDPVVLTLIIDRLIPIVIEKEGQTVIIEDLTAKEELKSLKEKLKNVEEQLDEYQKSFFDKFNENIEKYELINVYLDIISGLAVLGDSTRNALIKALEDLDDKDEDYTRLIRTLEQELQKDPEVYMLIIDRLTTIVGEGQAVLIEDETAKEELKKMTSKMKNLETQLDGYQEAFLQEFNKNVEKDELIKTYRELINGLSTLGDSTRNELLSTLKKLSEKDADYDTLIKTLEDEIQKEPIVLTLIIDRLIPIVIEKEGQTVIIEDETSKDTLKDLAKQIKSLEEEKDAQILKLRGERDTCNEELNKLRNDKINALNELNNAQETLKLLRAEIELARKKPSTANAGTGTDTSGLSIDELQVKAKKEEEKIKNLQLKIVQYETKIRNLERESSSSKATVEAQKARLDELQRQIDGMKEANRLEIQKLTDDLNFAANDRDATKQELQRIKTITDELRSNLDDCNVSLDTCNANIAKKDKELDDLRKRIGEDGGSKLAIEKLIAEKNALILEKRGIEAAHADALRIKNKALSVSETGRLSAEAARDEALRKLQEEIDKNITDADAAAALLAAKEKEFDEKLQRVNASRDGASASADSAAQAAALAITAAETARDAASSGQADALTRATEAEALRDAAIKARDAAIDAAKLAAADAARLMQEAEAAKLAAAASLAEAEKIKAEGERNLAAARTIADAAKAESSAAVAATAEAAKASAEASKLREEAERIKAEAAAGRNADAAAVAAAEAAVVAAEAAAVAAEKAAKEAKAAADAANAAAAAEVAKAKAEADTLRAAAIAARTEAEAAKAEAASAQAESSAARDAKEKAEAASHLARLDMAAAIKDAKAARAEADAARAEAAAARAEAEAANARAKTASEESKAAANQANKAAAVALEEANRRVLEAEEAARNSIAAANRQADAVGTASREASDASVSAMASELAQAKAAAAAAIDSAKAEADQRVSAAEADLAKAQAAATASAAALEAMKVSLAEANAKAEAAESRARKAEIRLSELEPKITDLQNNLELCENNLKQETTEHEKTRSLLSKLLGYVALDDEEDKFKTSEGEFRDFKQLKKSSEPASNKNPEIKDTCKKALYSIIGNQLKADSVNKLPEDYKNDIFNIYNIKTSLSYDNMQLFNEINSVLIKGKEVIDSDKIRTTIVLPLEILQKIIANITSVKRPIPDFGLFIDKKLLNYALSFNGKEIEIKDVGRLKSKPFEVMKDFPLGILAIKYLQLCKELYGDKGPPLVKNPMTPDQLAAVKYIDTEMIGKSIPSKLSQGQMEYLVSKGKPVGSDYVTSEEGLSLEQVKNYEGKSGGKRGTRKRNN